MFLGVSDAISCVRENSACCASADPRNGTGCSHRGGTFVTNKIMIADCTKFYSRKTHVKMLKITTVILQVTPVLVSHIH